MKSCIIILIFTLKLAQNCNSQSVSINTTGAQSDSSAILDVSSADKGVLIPRMTITQRNAILNPAIGLTIWNLDCDEFQVFNGTIWKNMSGFAACSSAGPPNVKICSQTWMVKNLDVDTYRDGTPIPQVTDPVIFLAIHYGAWCYYQNDSANGLVYGKLYNWYAVNGDSDGDGIKDKELAPEGWHIPSQGEWNILVKCIDPAADTSGSNNNPSSTAGGAMKETGTSHWLSPNIGATNRSGFTALPGGFKVSLLFSSLGLTAYFWSATEPVIFGFTASGYSLPYHEGSIYRSDFQKYHGISVRCVKD